MKRLRLDCAATLAILLAASVLPAARANARDLSDILMDKGLITRDEKAEADRTPTGPTIAYKEGTGFVFATPDNRFELDLGGYAQFRYTLTDVDNAYQNAGKGVEDSQSFDFPRVRIWLQGHAFTPRLNYKFESDFTAGGGDIPRDYYLDYALVDSGWLNVKGGQWKVPFSRQEMTSDSKQEFTDRSLAVNNLRFERARGVQMYGTPLNSLFEYYAGAFNTTGRNGPANPDNNFLYSTRLAVNPLGPIGYSEADTAWTDSPLLGIGVGYAYEKVRADEFTTNATSSTPSGGGTPTLTAGAKKNNVPFLLTIQPFYNALSNPGDVTAEVNNLEGDMAFKWKGFFIEAEYLRAWVSNDQHADAATPIPPFKRAPNSLEPWGYNAQIGYFVIPKKLELAFRYSELTPDDNTTVKKSDGRVIVPRQQEILGAVNYYFWAHNLKLISDFGQVVSQGVKDNAGNIEDRDDFRLRVQVQLIF